MKKFALLFVAVLFVVVSACSVESVSDLDAKASINLAGNSPVKLLYSNIKTSPTGSGGVYPSYLGSVDAYIEIDNLGYEKQVICHYNEESSSDWYDVQATYVKTLANGKEIWHFQTEGVEFVGRWEDVEFSFAIKYAVNGTEYWDNNDGQDYHASYGIYSSYPPVVLGASALKLQQASFSSYAGAYYFMGAIILKNIAYNKNVQVFFTQDNWKTSKQVSAVYGSKYTGWGGMEVGYENWGFSTTFPTMNDVTFAVSYTVNGITYWDNNLENDYTVKYNGSYNF